jgi:hypothetical protein
MPECRKKLILASAFLTVVNFVSPASAFRHQGQSGTAGPGLGLLALSQRSLSTSAQILQVPRSPLYPGCSNILIYLYYVRQQ